MGLDKEENEFIMIVRFLREGGGKGGGRKVSESREPKG